MSKLIIIRGPSGSGKSTVTQELMRVTPRLSAHIDQDVYRFIFTDKDVTSAVRHEMIKSDVLIALTHGCDVILDGILSRRTYGEMFEELFAEHPEENYAFYLEASFEETVRRHQTRPQANDFTPEQMREWYNFGDPLGGDIETVIPETSTLAQTIATIREVTRI